MNGERIRSFCRKQDHRILTDWKESITDQPELVKISVSFKSFICLSLFKGRKAERKSSFIHWFTLQNHTKVKAGSGQADTGTQSRSCMWVAGSQVLEPGCKSVGSCNHQQSWDSVQAPSVSGGHARQGLATESNIHPTCQKNERGEKFKKENWPERKDNFNFERGEFLCQKIEDVDVVSDLEMTAVG